MWNHVTKAAKNACEWLWNLVADKIVWLRDRVEEFVGWLKDRLIEARDWLWDRLKGARDFIVDKVSGAVEWLKDRLIDARDFIVDKVSGFVEWLKGKVKDMVDWLWDKISDGVDWLKDRINDTRKTLSDKIEGASSWLRDQLYERASWINNQFVSAFDGAVSSILEGFGEPLLNTLKGFFSWAGAQLSEVGKNIFTWVNEQALPWLQKKLGWIWEKAKEGFKEYTSTLFDFLKKLAPVTPEKAWNALPEFLALAGGLSLAAVGLASLPSLKVAGTGVDLSALAQHVSKLFSPEIIIAGVLGTAVGLAFTTPIKYYLNSIFRSFIPDLSVFHEALGRSKIDDETFKKALAWHGIPDEWFNMYKELAARPISPFIMRYFADAEIVDPSKFYEFALDQGYKPEYADYVAKGMAWGAVKSYRIRVENEVTRAYQEGYIDEETWRSEVEKVRQIVDAVKLESMYAMWKAFNDDTAERVKAVLQLVRQGVVSLEEARKELSKYIARESKIDDLLYRELQLYEAEAEYRTPNSLRSRIYTVIINCYKEGYIDEETFMEAVDAVRQVYDVKTLMKMEAEWKAFYDDRGDWVKVTRYAYRYGLITEEEFLSELSKYIVRPQKLQAIYLYEHNRIMKGLIEAGASM